MRVVLDTNTLIRAHHRISQRSSVTPRFQQLYGLTDAELLEYAQFLQSISTLVSLDSRYRAPLRDPYDLIVLQTAELGEADILCTHDDDFYDHTIRAYCAARGIEVCDEASLLKRLT